MARPYHIDELLWLRSSPLVSKPAGLPPVEEWMGPIPDPTTQRKTTNPRDPNNPTETTPRRSSIFESRHISRNSNSGNYDTFFNGTNLSNNMHDGEDIVLGPPKTAFASASRISGKGSIDSTERPAKPLDSEDPKNDRFSFREKFFKERDTPDRDFDRRDAKQATFNGRRGGEREDWNNGRPRRTFGPDEQERKPRRNGEFDRWENTRELNRDRGDQRDSNVDRGTRENKDSRLFPRRDGQPPRARHEGSWFRDDSTQDAPEAEEEKTPVRNREWRRDRHGADRDWTRGAKFEQEPEWLDAGDRDEPRRVHTQEDFERWKERMKAGSFQAHTEEKKETVPVEQQQQQQQQPPSTGPSEKAEARPTDGEIFSSNGTPFQGDQTMERFFGLLNEAKPSPVVSVPSPLESTSKKEATLGKSAKSSRFAGLFSPPHPGSPAKEFDSQFGPQFGSPFASSQFGSKSPPGAPPVPLAPSHDADQEGFQRILQMLGGGKSRNATPHNDGAQANRPPSLGQAEQVRSEVSSPSREQLKRPEHMAAMQDTPVRSTGPALKENMYAPDPHHHHQAHQARDREHLLRLMQQVRVSPVTNQGPGHQGQPQSAGPAPGMLNMSEMMPHPPPGLSASQKTPAFLDDPAIANLQRPEADHLRRRPAEGPPMGYFDDMPFPQGSQMPITPGGNRAPQGQGLPAMGMQRPPGFEHMPPPGWTGPQIPPPPQQAGPGPASAPLGPPPGIPTPTRGIGHPSFMANMMPMHGNVPPPPQLVGERPPFPRGVSGGGSAGFPPPGMMPPPPGYMNGPPPPSGFPPMPHNGDGMMGLGPGGQGPPFPGNPGPQGPPPSSRHLLDVFGQVGGDARGGMIGPGQFR